MGGEVDVDDVPVIVVHRSRHTVLQAHGRGGMYRPGVGLAIHHPKAACLEQLHLEAHIQRVAAGIVVFHPRLHHPHAVPSGAQQRHARIAVVVEVAPPAEGLYLGTVALVQGVRITAARRHRRTTQSHRAVDVGRKLAVGRHAQSEVESDVSHPRTCRHVEPTGDNHRVHAVDVVPQRRVHSRGHAPRVNNHLTLRPQTRARHAAHDHSENQSFYFHL